MVKKLANKITYNQYRFMVRVLQCSYIALAIVNIATLQFGNIISNVFGFMTMCILNQNIDLKEERSLRSDK